MIEQVGKNTPDHVSIHTKYLLDKTGFDGEYTFGLWVIEPGGHAFKIGGILSDPNVGYYASFGDPQWCVRECSWGLKPGFVDMTYKYEDAEDLRFSGSYDTGKKSKHNQLEFVSNEKIIDNANNWLKNRDFMNIVIGGCMIFIGLCLIGYYFCFMFIERKNAFNNCCCNEYISV